MLSSTQSLVRRSFPTCSDSAVDSFLSDEGQGILVLTDVGSSREEA
jgi:hypothetical protein